MIRCNVQRCRTGQCRQEYHGEQQVRELSHFAAPLQRQIHKGRHQDQPHIHLHIPAIVHAPELKEGGYPLGKTALISVEEMPHRDGEYGCDQISTQNAAQAAKTGRSIRPVFPQIARQHQKQPDTADTEPSDTVSKPHQYPGLRFIIEPIVQKGMEDQNEQKCHTADQIQPRLSFFHKNTPCTNGTGGIFQMTRQESYKFLSVFGR